MSLGHTKASAETERLVGRALTGDQQAFTALYSAYAPRVLAYCKRLLGDRILAEEAVQCTFIRAFQSLSTLESPRVFFYWLFSIARNEVYASIREHRRNGRMDALSEESVWLEDPSHDAVVSSELNELIEQCLARLKHEYREVLVLRHFEELSYAEISAITGDTISSVESRLTRARRALMERMKPYVEEWKRS